MDIFDLSSEELVMLAVLLAKRISRGFTIEEIELLSLFFESVSVNLDLFAIKDSLDEERKKENDG